ncbi:MAG: putative sterol carrier protein [Myxococcota bacterium]|jgi:putative sterol carrier protein
MSTTKDVFTEMDEMLKADPEKTKAIDGSFKFNVTGEGAGLWVVDCREVEVREVDGEADVTITVDGADLVAIRDGELDPMQAFMIGKVQVDGDYGLAMKLRDILPIDG